MGNAPTEARFLLNDLARELASAAIDSPRRDANLILQMALLSDEPILMHHEVSLSPAAQERLTDLMQRRKQGCPISRLRGSREFYSLEFALNEATLDPRPDSEVMVEAAIAHYQTKSHHKAGSLHIGDFGTGSGCLLLSVLANAPHASGIGLDISGDAVRQATANAATHSLSHRAEFIISDWDDALDRDVQFDMILTNPPYIPTGDEPNLAPEVRLFDPALALFAGASGLDAYRCVMRIVARRLAQGGVCFVEIGQGQEDDVTALGIAAGLVPDGQLKDLAGIIRVLKFLK